MHHKVEILSLKKNEFVYKKLNRKRRTFVFSSVLICVLSLFTITGKLLLNSSEDKLLMSVLNPIYSPYVETGNTIFTSGDYQLESKELNFVAPVNFKNCEIFNNEIVFELLGDNIISAIEDGVVIEIGETTDNIKFIKILHCDNHVSIYEGVDVCGVEVGNKVDKGSHIGTSLDNKLKLSLFKENNPLLVDKIFDNQIVCKW